MRIAGIVVLAIGAALIGATPPTSATVDQPATTISVGVDDLHAATESSAEGHVEATRVSAIWVAGFVAMVAALVIVAVRRRSRRATDTESLGLSDETAALLERRALRRARVVIPEDPIVASIGIDDRPGDDPDRAPDHLSG